MTHPVRHGRGGLSATLHELDDLRTRMDQLMRAVFPIGGYPESGTGEPWAPLADIVDTEDAYLVELELPGVDKDQITVEVAEGDHVDEAMSRGWSVLAVGPASVVTEPDAVRGLVRRAHTEPWPGGARDMWVSIRPTRLTGRRVAPVDQ
ncbi:hypothetical protein STENM223S_03499 [Streptomyces tendae]